MAKVRRDQDVAMPDPEFIPPFDVFVKYMQRAYLQYMEKMQATL